MYLDLIRAKPKHAGKILVKFLNLVMQNNFLFLQRVCIEEDFGSQGKLVLLVYSTNFASLAKADE